MGRLVVLTVVVVVLLVVVDVEEDLLGCGSEAISSSGDSRMKEILKVLRIRGLKLD